MASRRGHGRRHGTETTDLPPRHGPSPGRGPDHGPQRRRSRRASPVGRPSSSRPPAISPLRPRTPMSTAHRPSTTSRATSAEALAVASVFGPGLETLVQPARHRPLHQAPTCSRPPSSWSSATTTSSPFPRLARTDRRIDASACQHGRCDSHRRPRLRQVPRLRNQLRADRLPRPAAAQDAGWRADRRPPG